MAATRERVEEARERERVATEKSEVQNESVGGIQSAPVEIKDLERPNVAGELCAATGALNAYVDTFKFNLSGTHPDLRVWVTRGTTSGPPEVVFPRMTTTFGVRSADGSETNTRVHKNLDLNVANPLITQLVTSTETRLLSFLYANRVTVFGREMTDQGVKAMFIPLIRPLPLHFRCEAYSKYVRVKVAPTQHVKLYTGEGTSTHVTVGVSDIRRGDDVAVTVKLVPYVSNAYFGVLCVCTHALLYTHELKNWERQTHVEAKTATLEAREGVEAESGRVEAHECERMEVERKRVEAEARKRERERVEAEARKREQVEAEAEARERERVEAERKRMEAEARERERVEAERKRMEEEARERKRMEEEARERERVNAVSEARERKRVDAENTRRERLAIEATKKRVEAENARLMASLLETLEQEVRSQIDAERVERTRRRVKTEREEREAAEAAIGERVRAAAEARNAERLQAAIDATKANLVSDADWRMPEVLTTEEPCYACNGSGTSYWCDGDYGSCLECCCIRCNQWNSACNCTDD